MASTDTHNAMPGGVEEKSFAGHLGSADASPTQRAALNTEEGNTSNNPGGLIGIWAEENSRDSLFDSMQRREVFGTSGPRIRPRFFASWEFPSTLCDDPQMISKAYATGVPMGSELPEPSKEKSPTFLLTALRDPGTRDSAGGLLQRIQVIKGWADTEGRTHQAIFDIAGGANDADVDPETCRTRGAGHESLCAVWQDPTFDPAIEAVYYARILENPSCRYSAWECLKLSGSKRPPACDDGSVKQIQQERAWTSPIWYYPPA
jgi:hypothetical protein